jgi:hypothetical protein
VIFFQVKTNIEEEEEAARFLILAAEEKEAVGVQAEQ